MHQMSKPNYHEQWGVRAGRELYILNEKQIKILKEASVKGERGIIWFEKFAISIPHIEGIYLINRRISDQLSAGDMEGYRATGKQRKEARDKIEEMKKRLTRKFDK